MTRKKSPLTNLLAATAAASFGSLEIKMPKKEDNEYEPEQPKKWPKSKKTKKARAKNKSAHKQRMKNKH